MTNNQMNQRGPQPARAPQRTQQQQQQQAAQQPKSVFRAKEPRSSSTLALTVAVGGLAFVVGSLVTLQLADLGGTEPQMQADAPVIAPEPEAEVTRSAAAASTETLTPVHAAATTDAAVTANAVANMVEEVVEDDAPAGDAVTALAAISEATGAAQEADRQASIDEAVAIAHRNKMRMLTEGVVAGLYTVSTDEDNQLVLSSVNASTTLSDLEGFVAVAAETGQIELPEQHASADGSVDAPTIIFDLVQQALLEGDETEQAAAQEMARRAFAASRAQTEVVAGERFYTVETGDSLAYIALQFYGNTGAYAQIYEANRDVLESPDLIKVGQRLRIPNA